MSIARQPPGSQSLTHFNTDRFAVPLGQRVISLIKSLSAVVKIAIRRKSQTWQVQWASSPLPVLRIPDDSELLNAEQLFDARKALFPEETVGPVPVEPELHALCLAFQKKNPNTLRVEGSHCEAVLLNYILSDPSRGTCGYFATSEESCYACATLFHAVRKRTGESFWVKGCSGAVPESWVIPNNIAADFEATAKIMFEDMILLSRYQPEPDILDEVRGMCSCPPPIPK